MKEGVAMLEETGTVGGHISKRRNSNDEGKQIRQNIK